MKRHTIFIYTAALLTMLGTALPLSAQNKSFTVNRNDGASQKYSYSQGDRLVLSREDSQGKKHADFVEQQVYVGNDVHNIPLTSIESITFDTQATEDEGKTFVIQESGGKVEYDDITIDFPSGTFNSSTKVTISEVEKGKIDGEDELSKYYKVKFGGGVRKSFNIGVKSPEYADDNALKMQFAMMGFAPSLGEQMMAPNLIDVSYLDNSYVAAIPEMDSPDDVDNIEVYFGLRNYFPIEIDSTAFTRAIYLWDYNFIPLSTVGKEVFWKLGSSWIPDAINKIEELGFKKSGYDTPTSPSDLLRRCINYYLFPIDDENNNGCCICSPWSKASSIIWINSNIFLGNDVNIIQKTIIHETLHYYQLFYDVRPATLIYLNRHTRATILEEASSTWIEKYYGEKLSKNTRDNVDKFLPSLNPDHDDILGDDVTGEGEKRYQNLGYGMSALLEYLSQKKGDDIVMDMWNRRNWSINPFNTIGFVEDAAKNKGIDIFTQKEYKVFVEALGLRKVYGELGFSDMVSDVRAPHDNQGGILSQTISITQPDVSLINWVYGYGALLENLKVNANNYVEELKCTIKQTTPGLKTWVYLEKRRKGETLSSYEPIGMITNSDSPMDISAWFYKTEKNEYLKSYNFYMVTIADNFKTSEDILSKIDIKIEDEVEFEVEPDHLDFEAGGGTQKLTVTTNQPKFKSEQDEESKRDGWLKISEVEGGVNVTATPNTEPKEWKGYVRVTPINAAGKALEGKAVTIPVTQKPSFLLKVEPNPITLPGYGSEFKNGKMTSSFTVKYIKDAKSVNVRVEFEQDDKDKSWLTLDGDWASQTSDDMLFICKRNFTVTPNTSFTKPRSAKIIVELTMPDGSKPDPEIVPVTQEPMEGKLIIEAPDPLWLKAEEYAGAEFSDRQEVTINTNLLDEAIEKLVFKEEKLSSSKGWLKYEHKEKSKTIVIYADAYPEEKTPRDGIIYYSIVTTDGKEFPASVNVKQQGRGAGALFTINPSTIRFEAKASEMLVKVEGENVEGISSFDVQWPSWLGGAHSTLSKTLSLTATQNESKEERSKVFTLTVKMKNGDLVSRQFVAYQDGANDDEDPDAPYIAINSSLTFNNKGGSETVQYSTNQPDIAWETNCYWLTIEKTSDGLLVSAKPNLGNKDSSAKIIVYALDKYKNKVADVTINVKQQKGDGYKILVGKYYHESTKSVYDPEQGKYVVTVEWYDELSITESSYTIKHVSNTNPSASYTKTGDLKISKLEVYRLTPAIDESTGIFNRDVSNWTDYDGYYMSGKFNINGEDGGFTGSYIESSRYGHSYKLIYPIGGGNNHYKISNDPNDPILP